MTEQPAFELWLVDVNPRLVRAWAAAFGGRPHVHVVEADILKVAENTIVSPANSHGLMDGGIDQLYLDRFGAELQGKAQQAAGARPEGHLPVGAAVLLRTGDEQIPYMISAPTMVTPGPVQACNAFFAMSAVLRVAYRHRDVVTKAYCPGLGTGVGEIEPEAAAREMANAHAKWLATLPGKA